MLWVQDYIFCLSTISFITTANILVLASLPLTFMYNPCLVNGFFFQVQHLLVLSYQSDLLSYLNLSYMLLLPYLHLKDYLDQTCVGRWLSNISLLIPSHKVQCLGESLCWTVSGNIIHSSPQKTTMFFFVSLFTFSLAVSTNTDNICTMFHKTHYFLCFIYILFDLTWKASNMAFVLVLKSLYI